VSKPTPRSKPGAPPVAPISVVRTGIAAALVVLGIAWMVVYLNAAAGSAPGETMAWMGDLERWNFLIGFLLVFLGLAVAADPGTPLGRGRGVVAGMLGCFLLGLIWIVVYYVAGSQVQLPLMAELGQYNLIVGIGFMAVGFVYATKWE
jgi:hypothetical protein